MLLERLAGGQRGVADHVRELAREIEIAAAVVAQVEDQVGDVRRRRGALIASMSGVSAVAM